MFQLNDDVVVVAASSIQQSFRAVVSKILKNGNFKISVGGKEFLAQWRPNGEAAGRDSGWSRPFVVHTGSPRGQEELRKLRILRLTMRTREAATKIADLKNEDLLSELDSVVRRILG